MRKHLFRHTISASAIAMALIMASCSTHNNATTARSASSGGYNKKSSGVTRSSSADFKIPAGVDQTTVRLLKEAGTWIGTPYTYGGNTTNGVDCSGFVLQVYLNALNIKLPRTSAKQQESCLIIDKNQLSVGDLVFFTIRGGSDIGHVGIYIGDGKMVHASSSKGVIVSPINQKYYVDNFHSAGRVMPFVAMKERNTNPSSQATVNIASAKTIPSTKRSVKTAGFPTASAKPGPATAASMEISRQKALQSLLKQVEDSIENAQF